MKQKITIVGILTIAILTVYGMIAGSVSGDELVSGLVYDFAFLTFLIMLVNYLYEYLNQNSLSYGLLISAIMLHMIGAVFFYGTNFGVLQYDMFMHGYSGFVFFVFSYRILLTGEMTGFLLAISAAMMSMGFTAFHETVEFISYGFAGARPGLFTFGGDMVTDYMDLSVDLISDLVGALVGMAAFYINEDWFK